MVDQLICGCPDASFDRRIVSPFSPESDCLVFISYPQKLFPDFRLIRGGSLGHCFPCPLSPIRCIVQYTHGHLAIVPFVKTLTAVSIYSAICVPGAPSENDGLRNNVPERPFVSLGSRSQNALVRGPARHPPHSPLHSPDGGAVLLLSRTKVEPYHHVQAINASTDQYAEAALGNREYS
jgi:hypothetical protein